MGRDSIGNGRMPAGRPPRRPFPAMADLLVLKARDAESAEAPEFRYLLSQVVLGARRAFGEVRVETDPAAYPELAGEGAVLFLGAQNALVAQASLAAMRGAL